MTLSGVSHDTIAVSGRGPGAHHGLGEEPAAAREVSAAHGSTERDLQSLEASSCVPREARQVVCDERSG